LHPNIFLRKVYATHEELSYEGHRVKAQDELGTNIIGNIRTGWGLFVQQIVALVIVANAFLWLTVLSPHDVVMTAWLKSNPLNTTIETYQIGIFRALGAGFGILATFLFPIVHNRVGLINASKIFITWEAVTVTLALFAYYYVPGVWGFLAFILLSRVGLYGWDVGQIEVLQIGIPEVVRGTINAIDSSFTKLATLLTVMAGFALPNPQTFYILIWGSVISISFGAVLFWYWTFSERGEKFNKALLVQLRGHPEGDEEIGITEANKGPNFEEWKSDKNAL